MVNIEREVRLAGDFCALSRNLIDADPPGSAESVSGRLKCGA
jgi:hypothetical protein